MLKIEVKIAVAGELDAQTVRLLFFTLDENLDPQQLGVG